MSKIINYPKAIYQEEGIKCDKCGNNAEVITVYMNNASQLCASCYVKTLPDVKIIISERANFDDPITGTAYHISKIER